MNLIQRPRRLRQSAVFREINHETQLGRAHLMMPYFITSGSGIRKKHPHLSVALTLSRDELEKEIGQAREKGVDKFLLFEVSDKRDAQGSEALNENSALCESVKRIRDKFDDVLISTDIALDPYTDHGHDGLFKDGKILNDQTVEVLQKMSALHAKCGAQMVAPSDMMDGRVLAIRERLDEEGFQDCAIMSYTAKYASAFYGPFRDTLGSNVVGDKKTYQMNPANRREALRELHLDLDEGADIVMVKPAIHYLDVIADVKLDSNVPVAAYHVSGECAMLEAGVKAGLYDRTRAIYESLLAIRRAGADLIATYFAVEFARDFR